MSRVYQPYFPFKQKTTVDLLNEIVPKGGRIHPKNAGHEDYTITPFVAKWFEGFGYICHQQYRLFNKKRIDILAVHKETVKTLIIEVKHEIPSAGSITNTINQIHDYYTIYGNPRAIPIIVTPKSPTSLPLLWACVTCGVALIELPIETVYVKEIGKFITRELALPLDAAA